MNEQELAVKITEVDQRSRSNSHRLEQVEKKQNTLESDVLRRVVL